MIRKFTRNPWILFSLLLIIYGIIIKLKRWPGLVADEIRYFDFARNLTHGFYSQPAPNINLWNGPGYPILIFPFVALKIPVAYIVFINGLFLYLSVVFLYKAVNLLTNNKTAFVAGLLLAFYPGTLLFLPVLYTEVFTGFLVSAFIYSTTLHYISGKRVYIVISGITLGYLMVTKIIFGYVIAVCLLICLLSLLFKKNRTHYLTAIYIIAVGFAVSTPYLIYTYKLTGKIFYWGDSGGMSLYWMSTPYEHEYGDWKVPDLSNVQYPVVFKSDEANAMLKNNHSKEMQFILSHNSIEADDLFKQIAIKNIKAHPVKFFKNYIDNVSRLLYNYPYSYAYYDDTYVRNLVSGSLVLWASLISLVLTFVNWRNFIFPVKFTLLVTGVYLLLTGALSAYPRQLDVIVPVLIFWTSFIIGNMKIPDLKFQKKQAE